MAAAALVDVVQRRDHRQPGIGGDRDRVVDDEIDERIAVLAGEVEPAREQVRERATVVLERAQAVQVGLRQLERDDAAGWRDPRRPRLRRPDPVCEQHEHGDGDDDGAGAS